VGIAEIREAKVFKDVKNFDKVQLCFVKNGSKEFVTSYEEVGDIHPRCKTNSGNIFFF